MNEEREQSVEDSTMTPLVRPVSKQTNFFFNIGLEVLSKPKVLKQES